MTQSRQVDGREAYRDDARWTAPEMQPGHGEDLSARPDHSAGGLASAMAMPAAGGILTGHELGQRSRRTVSESELVAWAAIRHQVDSARFGFMRDLLALVAGNLSSLRHRLPKEPARVGPIVLPLTPEGSAK